jgi:mannose-6-phosphate isomerase
VAPVRLAPKFVHRIWGARDLRPLFSKKIPKKNQPIGEVWATGDDCEFATGEFAGRKLREVWPALSSGWTGTSLSGLPRIPLLVKFIFPEEKLSVQVHPDDDYARRNEAAAGGVGKTEMWYVVNARRSASVRVGLRPKVTRESFEAAIAKGTVEKLLSAVPLRPGEAVFVPAGMAHTICPDMVLCEIQQHSDITYRIFDYNRPGPDGKPRELHIQKALDVINFDSSATEGGGLCDPLRVRCGDVAETFYAACRYFATERWEFRNRIDASTSPEHFELLIFLKGRGRIQFAGGAQSFGPADVWLLPAALGAYRLAPTSPVMLLRSYVPDLDCYARQLADKHIPEAEWSRVVHR